MTRILATLALVFAVAACGADGDPVTPTANIGVGVSNNGVHAGANVGLRKGPVSVNVNVF